MKKITVAILLCLAVMTAPPAVSAQDRSRLAVFVAPPTGGTGAEQNYFLEQFRMELIGANYPAVETKEESAYTLFLDISNNEGYDPRYPADASNRPFILGIRLVRSADDTEIVAFNFAFVDIDMMPEWNLYLLYQALANAYGIGGNEEEGKPLPDTALWQNQMLYLNLGLGADMGFLLTRDTRRVKGGLIVPLALAGLECHVLSFFSVELDAKGRFWDDGNIRIPAAAGAALLKGVVGFPAVMMEPYGGAEAAIGFGGEVPFLSVIAGVQFGVKSRLKNAWVLDIGAAWGLEPFTMADGEPYDMLRVHLTIGYKFGFIDRKAEKGNGG